MHNAAALLYKSKRHEKQLFIICFCKVAFQVNIANHAV